MLTAWAVAHFALDIGEISEARIIGLHARPVAIGQQGWNCPTELRRHVIKAAVDRQRVSFIAGRVTFKAGLGHVAPEDTVKLVAENMRVKRLGPRRILVRRYLAATVAQGTGIHSHICAGDNVQGQIGGSLSSSSDGGRYRVGPGHIRAEEYASGHLRNQAIRRFINRDIRSERTVRQHRCRAYRPAVQRPSDAGDVRGWNGDVHVSLQISRHADAYAGQAA